MTDALHEQAPGEGQPLPLPRAAARVGRPPRARDGHAAGDAAPTASRSSPRRSAPTPTRSLPRASTATTSRPPRCARFRERTGWAGAAGPAARSTSASRSRRGWPAARPTRAPRCGSRRASRASATTTCCARSPLGLGADVPAQVRPARYLATGAGEALRALPGAAAATASSSSAAASRCRRRTSSARPTGCGLAARRRRTLAERARGGRRPPRAGPARRPARQRPRARRPCRCCPERRRRARRRARRRRRARARLRLGPDRGRPVRDVDAARGGRGRPRRPRRRAGRRGAVARACGAEGGGVKPVWLVAAAALAAFLVVAPPQARADAPRRRRDRRRRAGGLRHAALVKLPNLEETLISIGETLGPWTYLLVGALAFLETGAFIGLIAPGETAMLLGGLVAGQGQINVVTLIGVVWACAVAGDLTSYFLGRRLGPRVPRPHGTQGPDHRSAPAPGRGVLRPARRQGDPHRPLRRPRARDRAVPRRARAGCRCGASCPTTSSAPACGARRSSCSATSSGRASRNVVDYAKKGALGPRRRSSSLVVGIVWLVRWLRRAENRREARDWLERQAERPALRPFATVLRPVRPRERGPGRGSSGTASTPGDLGLELTTLLAVGGGRGVRVHRAHRHARRRRCRRSATARRYDMAVRLEIDPLVTSRRSSRSSGHSPVVSVLVLGAIGVPALAARRSPTRSSLAVGLVLTVRARPHHQGGDRPPAAARPAREHGPARRIPSGHAAYAIAWVAVAVIAQPRAARPRVAVRDRHGRPWSWRSRSALTPGLPARALAQRRHGRRGPCGGDVLALCGLIALSSPTCATMAGAEPQ